MTAPSITEADLEEMEAGAKELLDIGISEWERDSARQTLALVRDLREAREALAGCWGQDKTGDFLFVVRVKGLPAMSRSPMEVSHELARLWCPPLCLRFPHSTVTVEVDDAGQARAAGIMGGEP
jgi:hypothetical protein